MAESSEEKKLSLKLMVNVKAKKVVFAEANNEFVNFIVSLLSLPLSSVARVLIDNEKGMVGSVGTLYKSIESLENPCFENDIISKESALMPRATVSVPLLSLRELSPTSCRVFQCLDCKKISNVSGFHCYQRVEEKNHTCPASKDPNAEIVRGGAFYVVTDSLEVKPMSFDFIKSHAMETDDLEAKHVHVGLQEGLAILKASMETRAVLTSVFLK